MKAILFALENILAELYTELVVWMVRLLLTKIVESQRLGKREEKNGILPRKRQAQ